MMSYGVNLASRNRTYIFRVTAKSNKPLYDSQLKSREGIKPSIPELQSGVLSLDQRDQAPHWSRTGIFSLQEKYSTIELGGHIDSS